MLFDNDFISARSHQQRLLEEAARERLLRLMRRDPSDTGWLVRLGRLLARLNTARRPAALRCSPACC